MSDTKPTAMIKRVLAPLACGLVVCAVFTACESEPPPPMPTTSVAEEAATDTAEAVPDTGEQVTEQFFYTPIGKRDPFRPYYLDMPTAGGEAPTAGSSRDAPKTPLERFEIEQLKLVAIVSGISTPRAMVQAPNGKGYIIRRGTPIGKNGGRVARIKSDEVIVEEEYLDGNARRVLNRITVRLSTEPMEME